MSMPSPCLPCVWARINAGLVTLLIALTSLVAARISTLVPIHGENIPSHGLHPIWSPSLAPCTVQWLEQGSTSTTTCSLLNPINGPACRLPSAPLKKKHTFHSSHEASGLLPRPQRALPEASQLVQYLLLDKWFNHRNSAFSPPSAPRMPVPLRRGDRGINR